MNLVGLNQVKTMLTGDIINEIEWPRFLPDWDGTALEDVKPFNPGMPKHLLGIMKFFFWSRKIRLYSVFGFSFRVRN